MASGQSWILTLVSNNTCNTVCVPCVEVLLEVWHTVLWILTKNWIDLILTTSQPVCTTLVIQCSTSSRRCSDLVVYECLIPVVSNSEIDGARAQTWLFSHSKLVLYPQPPNVRYHLFTVFARVSLEQGLHLTPCAWCVCRTSMNKSQCAQATYVSSACLHFCY